MACEVLPTRSETGRATYNLSPDHSRRVFADLTTPKFSKIYSSFSVVVSCFSFSFIIVFHIMYIYNVVFIIYWNII